MKKVLSKREVIIVAISLLIITVVGIYIAKLHRDLASKDRIIASNSTLLKQKNIDENTSDNYVETVCAEYRKLYQSYREVRYPDPSKVDKHLGLPGSAKGQIDDCYLPD